MTAADEDALVCDFAETYHVYDYRSLPLRTAAALAQGLEPDSRVMRRLCGAEVRTDTLLMAAIADRLGTLIWMFTEDGSKGKNPPKYFLDTLLHREAEKETAGFNSGEDFMAEWRRLTGGTDNGD